MDGVGGAIQELYRVFARQPARPEIEACPCCVDSDDAARLEALAAPGRDG